LVIGNPSKVVPIDEGVPGVLTKIAEKHPPKMAPLYMAPKVARPVIGSIVNVKGTIKATAIVAEKPGSAPAIIPADIPTVIKSKFLIDKTDISA
jgi:hypothetical protein